MKGDRGNAPFMGFDDLYWFIVRETGLFHWSSAPKLENSVASRCQYLGILRMKRNSRHSSSMSRVILDWFTVGAIPQVKPAV